MGVNYEMSRHTMAIYLVEFRVPTESFSYGKIREFEKS